MRLAVVGTGYVGLVTGVCFASMGNDVVCVDVDEKKIENLKKGISPIFETGLEKMLHDVIGSKNISFSLDLQKTLQEVDVVFIAVGTPMSENGEANLTYVKTVAKDIGRYMEHSLVVVDKSTVPVGTGDEVKKIIQDELTKRDKQIDFSVVSNPEFLKEGVAIEDFMRPDRVIVGSDDQKALEVMQDLYEPFMKNHDRFMSMDIKSAEMTKYTANAMLATKISFMNEISNICEQVGADVNEVRRGIGSDSRIGYSFIYPGCGYGGSCFPKDVQALIFMANKSGYNAKILNSVEEVNKEQKYVISDKVVAKFGENLSGFVFGVWGLSFKPQTDDMREASSITIINELTKRGAKVVAYDPKAMDEAKSHYLKDNKNVSYVDSKYEVLSGCDALLLITEWNEFRSPDFAEIAKQLKKPIIFDGRNQYKKDILSSYGIEYHQIGVK